MKTKLLLSILLFGTLLQTKAQDLKQIMKSRPADYEYLSAPDSLAVRHSLKMPNSANKNSLTTQTKLPYPIIFIHGLNSGSSTWNTFTNFMDTNYLFNYGGRFDISLNDDNDLYHANLNLYPTVGADITMYQSTVYNGGDYYYVNFAVNSSGTYDEACANLSNQSAIAKQGLALRDVIIDVMQLTGRDKVILMGHSMGGLAAREYLQNPSNWASTNTNHHVAKLVTTGTPHRGSNVNYPDLTWFTSSLPDKYSEAVRDLRTTYSYSLQSGVFLYGGIESQSVMNDLGLPGNNFYNFDVNCNGVINENITGLNQKTPQYNLDYSCIIGNYFSDGDGVVSTSSANINNIATFNSLYTNLTQNIFYSNVIHTNLPSQNYQNFQGLDEPNDFSIAYGITFNKLYYAFISEQSQICSYAPTDFDDYKFTVINNSNISVSINIPSSLNLNARIVSNNQTTQIGPVHSSNGASNFTFTQNNLPVGDYFLEIYGIPTTSIISNYNFSLNSTLSTDNFESNNSLNLFPNPTSSKVFFDNANSNFKEVAVYNYLGQEVSKAAFISISTNQEVDMSGLSAGVYILKFSNTETSQSVKVVKQ